MKIARITGRSLVVLFLVACGGKVTNGASGGAGDSGTSFHDGGGPTCDSFAAARACAGAGGDCGSAGSTTCPHGYKPSTTNVCTDSCKANSAYVACCVPDFGPPPPPPDSGTTTGCAPADVTMWTPTPYVPANHQPGKCTTAQISSFYDDCLATNATMASCAPFGSTGTQANKDCAACLISTDTASSYGPLIESKGNISLNVAGCMEIEDGAMGLACARSYQASQECDDAACAANCPVTDDASFQLYEACVMDASANGCSRFSQAAQCANAESMRATAAVCFQGQTFQDLYTSLGGVFCGP